MSDSIEDLARRYKEHVHTDEHPRSIGLFTIPEYPELEGGRGMWSAALDAILTTLRYLAPATLLTLFWGQQSFLFKILKHIDSAFRAIVFSSEEQKQSVLQWLAEAGPVRVEHLDTVWRHGWILCGVLDAALPGACAGHPPTRLSLKHAQAIADHYLGVEPVFTRQELESNDSLSRHQEWKLATYLDRIREALSKLTPPVSKPVSQRTSPTNESAQFTLDYVAKGSGLSAAQLHHKAHFKIYPTAQQALDPGEITILIRGPKDTYGMTVLPPILGKAQMIRQKLLGLQSKQHYTENILPITQGATYMRTYGKNDMNKTYYIPKAKYDIEIETDCRTDHIKVSYVVNIEGKYLVSITSRGQNIAGSPFNVSASHNIISALEKDNFCLENGEEIDIVDIKTDRKVVLRIVDFVTEKMLLKENGTLEKISEDEAKLLMETDIKNKNKEFKYNNNETVHVNNQESFTKVTQVTKFSKVADKVMAMQRVCKAFHDTRIESELRSAIKECYISPRTHKHIPDIVNSTLSESKGNSYGIPELREKLIVPENISVSLRAEKSKTLYDQVDNNVISHNIIEKQMESDRLDSPDRSEIDENDSISIGRLTPTTNNNPFLNEMFEENYAATKSFGTFIASEYETNNSQNEETRDSSIKIIIDSNITSTPQTSPNPTNSNPFIEIDELDFGKQGIISIERPETAELERPKTPVYKIIAGEKLNRDEPVFIDPSMEESLGNEFINPFFMHHLTPRPSDYSQTPLTDFIIGAPVSLPPIIRAPSPEPKRKSLVLEEKKNPIEISKSDFSTSVHSNLKTNSHQASVSPTLHSLESNLTDNNEHSNASNASDNESDRNSSPRKDIWDSAYVSIDDNHSSPDSNNNENAIISDTLCKHKIGHNDDNGLYCQEMINMGPAEREMWQTCVDLKGETAKGQEEIKQNRWELKRPSFTPIIEESDRSLSSGVKTEINIKQGDTDSISVAFAELNDIYQEYFPNSETSSTASANEVNKLHSMDVELITQTKNSSVDSASEISDVKRHKEELEGMISEVQTNVTESVSVSQPLHIENGFSAKSVNKNKNETQFGETSHSNIVLEKKKYWDERIRQIEAKSAETPTLQKKKRTASKQLKHDSLSKRRGKQMIKNFLNSGDYSQVINVSQSEDISNKDVENKMQQNNEHNVPDEQVTPNEKLVDKWKKYWDTKLETEHIENETVFIRPKSPSHSVGTPSPDQSNRVEKAIEIKVDTQMSKHVQNTEAPPVKQELPEEVFKAFETSPKRFFGTSRKHILNKLDTFLGKPATVVDSTSDIPGVCHESGLVSSRISLFHNLSNTEELPWARRKSQSLHNISQRRESERSLTSMEEKKDTQPTPPTQEPLIKEKCEVTETTNEILSDKIKLRNKRARMIQTMYNKSFDETVCEKPAETLTKTKPNIVHSKKTTIGFSDETKLPDIKPEPLRKKSFSKSEMDIFNKLPSKTTDEYLDTYKSFDELPKINVKNFITLYESASKTSGQSKAARRTCRTSSGDSQNISTTNSIISDTVHKREILSNVKQTSSSNSESRTNTPGATPTNLWRSKDSETVRNLSLDTATSGSIDIEIISNEHKETTYLSLSDIELEIIESCPNTSNESTPEKKAEPAHIEYKNRFKMAKEYFQSLEDVREIKKPRKLNECELLLRKQSTESLETERPQKRVKKNIKSHSLPSSEISKIWNQLQESQGHSSNSSKLVKISEKFQVEDLFADVTEGKLSRQGSLRGIPHKKAVLEAFRSMENVAVTKINSYDFTDSELSDFGKDHTGKNAQTYLNEYPYLPTTDPAKYHSRLDVKASGLITLKELLQKKPRRNSVPDLRLNTKFTEDL